MSRILDEIEHFLKDDQWPATLLEDRPIYKTGYNGDHGEFNCYAQAREEQEQFVFYSVFPVKVPESNFQSISEYIQRANFGMIIGNFEIDIEDGEVRYKTSVDLEGVEQATHLLRNMVYANVLTMDKYFNGLMRILHGGLTPVEAIKEVEG
jgi:hypothetical protein